MVKMSDPTTNIEVELPRDVVREIALRLAVKSLMRFKAVSKWFQSLISDSSFIHQHLARATQPHNNLEHPRLAIFIQPWDPAIQNYAPLQTYVINNYNNNNIATTILLHGHRLKTREQRQWHRGELRYRKYFSHLSYCRGIFMMSARGYYFFLWNPSTGEKEEVPQSPIKMNYTLKAAALGYDSSTDTNRLKVVMFGKEENKGKNPRVVVDVYDVKTNSWTDCSTSVGIDDDDDGWTRNLCIDGYGVTLADGSVCWVDICNYYKIVCYDVAANKLKKLPLPPPAPAPPLGGNYRCGILDIMDGSLGVEIREYENGWLFRIEIWIMKKEKCWTKLTDIDINPGPPERDQLPLCYAKNDGQVLVSSVPPPMDDTTSSTSIIEEEEKCGVSLLVRHHNEIKPKITFPRGRWSHFHSISYVETLLPLSSPFHIYNKKIITTSSNHIEKEREKESEAYIYVSTS